jgi:transposase
LLLTAGNINDIGVARALLQKVGPVRRLIADRGYDANHLRRFLADQQAEETATASNACGAASGTGAARHKIRQARPQLPQRSLPSRYLLLLDKLSPDPSARERVHADLSLLARLRRPGWRFRFDDREIALGRRSQCPPGMLFMKSMRLSH